MFSEFFEGEYETKKFWIKGLEEDIEQIKSNADYETEVLSERKEDSFVVIEVSQYTDIESIIEENPNIMVVGFVEDWDVYDVYVAFSDMGSNKIDECERVGFFDRHHDINWHDVLPITTKYTDVEMSYIGDSDTHKYDFPFSSEWQAF